MRTPEDLLPILDEQIALLERRLRLMQGMADCVRRAALEELEGLLAGQEAQEAELAEAERRLEEARRSLAAAAGVPAGGLTLGSLIEQLDGPLAIALADRRERLLVLVQNVETESQRTAALVRHALEFSQRMIGALLGVAGEGELYSAHGEVRADANKTIVRHSV